MRCGASTPVTNGYDPCYDASPMENAPPPSGKEIASGSPLPAQAEGAADVRQCLGRILESPSFQASKRCQDFLRYVVEQALAGQSDSLKERVIGAEVFGRMTTYDTSSDAIVRVKANEVRKRLAQYYQDSGGADEVRIELPAGSYVPVITWLREKPSGPAVRTAETPGGGERLEFSRRRPGTAWLVAGTAVLAAAAGVLWLSYPRQSDLDRFWAPVLTSPEPVVMCMSVRDDYIFSSKVQKALGAIEPKAPSRLDLALQPDDVVRVPNGQMSLQSLRAVLDLAVFLTRNGKQTQFRTPADVSFDEIRKQAVVLVGSFYNPWTMQLNQELRFRFDFVNEGSRAVSWIRDSQAPNERKWVVESVWPYHEQPLDYAILSRVFDSSAQRVTVAAAGMSRFGTQVAGEFLTEPRYWNAIVKQAPSGWERMNCQIIIETKRIGATPGPPKVVATHFWAAVGPT